uniref:Secreted protein n=1 Tax=Haemonchus contortus TaxID=6289 RepID=A0A7I4YUF1_HAECO
MGTLFAAASAALAAQAVLMDDRQTHEVVAFVPSMTALPLRLQIELHNMTSESGWSRRRPVDVWITNSSMVARTTIARTSLNFTGQVLKVELHSEPRTHRAVYRAIERYGSVDRNTQCVSARLCPTTSGTEPLFEVFAIQNLFGNIPINAPSMANEILNMVYGSTRRRSMEATAPSRPPSVTTIVIVLLHFIFGTTRPARYNLDVNIVRS